MIGDELHYFACDRRGDKNDKCGSDSLGDHRRSIFCPPCGQETCPCCADCPVVGLHGSPCRRDAQALLERTPTCGTNPEVLELLRIEWGRADARTFGKRLADLRVNTVQRHLLSLRF